jgi:hypothetical protein
MAEAAAAPRHGCDTRLWHLNIDRSDVAEAVRSRIGLLSDRAVLAEEAGYHRPPSPAAHQSDSAGTLLAIGPGVTAPTGLPFNRAVIDR